MADTLDIIEVKNLSISYARGKKSINNCSFTVKKGQVFGLLGFNGAGKSTIIKTLCGIIKDYEGEIIICGKQMKNDTEEVMTEVNYVPQHNCMFDDFTVLENLKFFCEIEGVNWEKNKKIIKELLGFFYLERFKDIKAGKLSGGYRQLLNIALSMLKDKRVVVMDEPTAGLDLWAKKKVVGYIEKLKKEEKTVIITTHDLKEAEEICDTVLIISEGRILANGNMTDLLKKFGGEYSIKITLGRTLKIRFPTLKFSRLIKQTNEHVTLSATQEGIGLAIRELVTALEVMNVNIIDIHVVEPSLNAVFSNIGLDGVEK